MYHYQCLNMTNAYFVDKKHDLKKYWTCQSCVNVTRRPKKDDTPVRNVIHTSNDLDMPFEKLSTTPKASKHKSTNDQGCTASTSDTISLEQFSYLLESKLDLVRETLVTEMKKEFAIALESLKTEFSQTVDFLTNELKEVKDKVRSMNNKILELESKNANFESVIKSKKLAENEKELMSLKATIAELKADLNDKEQCGMLNDVAITGIPESEGESVLHIVIAVATKLGMTLEPKDVVNVSRIGSKKQSFTHSDSKPPRPRPITVRLARRNLRDEFLKNARVRRGITTSNLGLPQHEYRQFYINEKLTKSNRVTFARAREIGRAMNWKFVWTKEGRVYAKRNESSPAHFLRSETDVERVFGKLIEGNVII